MDQRETPGRSSPSQRLKRGYKSANRTPSPLISEPQEMMGKAHELFQLCDKEEKGLITKRDLQRLQNELPLTPEQLEAVFDSLDQSNNGYLTPVEFSLGLGKLLGVSLPPEGDGGEQSVLEETFESGWSDGPDDDDAEEMLFYATMEQLGAARVFQDHKEVRDLWNRLRKERPELLGNFEDFLYRVSSYIRDVHHEKETLEQALKRKEIDHGREVRCLYEEMEQQIKVERERLLRKGSSKHQDRHTALQRELARKEQELDCIVLRQKQLEKQLHSINSEQLETRVQNDRLKQLNEDLIEQLEKTKGDLEKAQTNLQQLRMQEQEEQERKKKDVFKVSKNMQKEKQSLMRQLELLREMNKTFRDEKDVFEAKKLAALKKSLAEPVSLPGYCCCSHSVASLPWNTGHSCKEQI
ncbi:EF-hand calcium-binding domain-containing protein 4A [Spea bombifrons]|uniref:EF-hand calcium-binding domain-containing protein 4A n=1 Tax=Spea bombifrons TaxID=233779 RepID=UPI00234B8836|nr:EF-hand calcium-binding domain-containing protein 4A [Spea bombifrons]XP_053304597.1 EF-hand calcium-binding domain-containing protein 4A [Spea bombifrons]